LRAARRGRLTSGLVKVGVLSAAGFAAAVVLSRGVTAQTVADGALIAATANLVNLFDLRPGRAAKLSAAGFAVVLAVGSLAVDPVAWCAGAALGTLPGDVHERLMLGDGGANAVGGALGVGLVVALAQPARVVVLAVVVALTLLSERVSFSHVIERTPPLRWLDRLWRSDTDQRAVA
jgi:UDP-N-acetylmuramyl pentapeptide phosphotransferase/UDP-N-acetylglucosamine-1-phosphate transferase